MENETRPDAPQAQRDPFRVWGDGLSVVVFSVGIALPLLCYLANRENYTAIIGLIANRQSDASREPLTLLKKTTLASLLTFPKRFEEHFSSHFGFRSQLVELSSKIKVFGFKDSSNRHVILGRNGWLYYDWDYRGHSSRNPRPFQVEELQQWRNVLEARKSWLKQRHCEYLFLIAPEKQSVYPQYLPDWTRQRPSVHTRTAQLKDYLSSSDSTEIIDLGDSLRASVADERLFHRTDTHWNDRGVLIAYSTVIQKLSEKFPKIEPLPPSRLRRSENVIQGLDLANMLGSPRSFREEKLEVNIVDPQAKQVVEEVSYNESQKLPFFVPKVFINSNHDLPTAIVIGDSFSFGMLPFLAEHFSRMLFLPEHVLDPMVIERERPDVVIQEIVERKLYFEEPIDPVLQSMDTGIPRLANPIRSTSRH